MGSLPVRSTITPFTESFPEDSTTSRLFLHVWNLLLVPTRGHPAHKPAELVCRPGALLTFLVLHPLSPPMAPLHCVCAGCVLERGGLVQPFFGGGGGEEGQEEGWRRGGEGGEEREERGGGAADWHPRWRALPSPLRCQAPGLGQRYLRQNP